MVKIDFELISLVCEAYGFEAHIDKRAYSWNKHMIGTPVNICGEDNILWSGVIDTDEDLNEAIDCCNRWADGEPEWEDKGIDIDELTKEYAVASMEMRKWMCDFGILKQDRLY